MTRAFVVLVALASVAHAIPAPPTLTRLTQPDGTGFQARQWGDEWAHGWQTEDGYTIVRDQDGRWSYATVGDNGQLVGTPAVVGVDPPYPGLSRELRPITPVRLYRRAARARPASPRGTWNLPVLLVSFADRVPSSTPQHFEQRLFGTNTHSLRDYYSEVSYGQFTVASGPSGISGWHQAPHPHDYYGEDAPGASHDRMERVAELIREAVAQAELDGFDFAPYDNDGDCQVDAVMVVYQGSVNEPDTIWPHFSAISPFSTQSRCGTGYLTVGAYTIQSERGFDGALSTIGVFAHEFGHVLGLPDLYDVDYSSAGVGDWSLMGGGYWLGRFDAGDRPAHLDPWSKTWLGWLQPRIVQPGQLQVEIGAVETTPDVYQLRDTNALAEYFLIENRAPIGFDEALPGAGLLIWHVAGGSNSDECYPLGEPSCLEHHYQVAVAQADGQWNLERNVNRGDGGDPFPGTSTNRRFDAASNPAARLYRGADAGVSVIDIGDPGIDMLATFVVAFPTVTPTLTPIPTRTPTRTPVLTATRTPTPTFIPTAVRTDIISPPPCAGDCDGNRDVTITDLLTLVQMASGDGGSCAAGDVNRDGQVTVDEILKAVQHALLGCA